MSALLGAALLGTGCGSDLHPAVHDPLVLVPGGANGVLVVDNEASRTLRNFTDFEMFLRNRDPAPEFRNRLPFDYELFKQEWQLDPMMSVDKVVVGYYGSGWLAVMNGQFYPDHVLALAASQERLETRVQRGGSEEVPAYPVATLNESLLGGIELAARQIWARLAPTVGQLAPLPTAPTRWHEAFPTQHLWIVSNSEALLNEALGLYETRSGDSLDSDLAFQRLWTERPRQSFLWLGFPAGSPALRGSMTSMQIEVDIRSYVVPRVTLGYETQDATTNAAAGIQQVTQMIAAYFESLPQIVQGPFDSDPAARLIEELGLVDDLAASADSLEVESLPLAQVIEVRMEIPLSAFKELFANLSQMVYR